MQGIFSCMNKIITDDTVLDYTVYLIINKDVLQNKNIMLQIIGQVD